MRINSLFGGIVALLCLGVVGISSASTFRVDVGYADNLRPSPFFPSIWDGSANTTFLGQNGGSFDSGAVMITNTGATSLTINDMLVHGFGSGASFQLWGTSLSGGLTVAAGQHVIFAQNSGFNFDSSDYQGGNPFAQPIVSVTIDSVLQNFTDTAQVLNTEGTDHLAAAGLNESHDWREIGTYGGQAAVPLPSVAYLGIALMAALGVFRYTHNGKRLAV